MEMISPEHVLDDYQRLALDLDLWEDEKQRMYIALDAGMAKLNAMAAKGESIDRAMAFKVMRSQVEHWLSPDRLVMWDWRIIRTGNSLGL